MQKLRLPHSGNVPIGSLYGHLAVLADYAVRPSLYYQHIASRGQDMLQRDLRLIFRPHPFLDLSMNPAALLHGILRHCLMSIIKIPMAQNKLHQPSHRDPYLRRRPIVLLFVCPILWQIALYCSALWCLALCSFALRRSVLHHSALCPPAQRRSLHCSTLCCLNLRHIHPPSRLIQFRWPRHLYHCQTQKTQAPHADVPLHGEPVLPMATAIQAFLPTDLKHSLHASAGDSHLLEQFFQFGIVSVIGYFQRLVKIQSIHSQK